MTSCVFVPCAGTRTEWMKESWWLSGTAAAAVGKQHTSLVWISSYTGGREVAARDQSAAASGQTVAGEFPGVMESAGGGAWTCADRSSR